MSFCVLDDFFRFLKNSVFWVFRVNPTVVSVLLSASVERFLVSCMRDFFYCYNFWDSPWNWPTLPSSPCEKVTHLVRSLLIKNFLLLLDYEFTTGERYSLIFLALVVQKLRPFYWRGGFCLLVELHQEGSALAACAAGLLVEFCHHKPCRRKICRHATVRIVTFRLSDCCVNKSIETTLEMCAFNYKWKVHISEAMDSYMPGAVCQVQGKYNYNC